MAFLNPVAFLCLRRRSGLLVRNLTPGHEVAVQAVRRVFATVSSDPPSKPSGPVRYVRKPVPHNELHGSRGSALETRKTNGWGSIHPNLPGEENAGSSNTYEERRYPKTSRGRGDKTSSDSRLSTALSTVEGKSTARQHRSSNSEVEEGGQDTLNPGLDVGEYLFGDTCMLKTLVEDVQVSQPGVGITDKDSSATAKNYVLGLLARGPQTEFNLRSKMTKKNVSPEVIDDTIKDLQRCGLQSDEEYAEIFARSRWTDNTWGPKRIKFELLRRGIRKDTVEAALVKLFQTSDTVGNQEVEDLGKWGMTTEAAEHLIAQARRRWSQGDLKIDVRRRRMIGWLQRRGFSWTIILDVLRITEAGEAS